MTIQPWAEGVRVAYGGLMRCCLATIARLVEDLAEEPENGTTFHCDFEKPESPDSILYENGRFKWAGAPGT